MEIEILQENLIKGLQTVSRVLSTKSSIPILSNIFFRAKENKLFLFASSMETGISIEIGAKVVKEGEFTVPGKTIIELVSSLPGGKIQLLFKEGILYIEEGKFKSKLNGIDASEYPPTLLENIDTTKGNYWELDSETGLSLFRKTLFCVSSDEGRAVLTGVLFKFTKDNLVVAATDGFRLSVVTVNSGKSSILNVFIIIPAKTLYEVVRLVSEQKMKNIVMGYLPDSNQAWFLAGDAIIKSRLISGNYPDYEKIIPSTSEINIVVNGEELQKALKLAAIFARESSNIVKLKINGKELEISANAAQSGENSTKIDIETKKEIEEEFTIAFNYRYLQDFLIGIDNKDFSIDFINPLSAAAFRLLDDNNFLHIIMPVRVQS